MRRHEQAKYVILFMAEAVDDVCVCVLKQYEYRLQEERRKLSSYLQSKSGIKKCSYVQDAEKLTSASRSFSSIYPSLENSFC